MEGILEEIVEKTIERNRLNSVERKIVNEIKDKLKLELSREYVKSIK
jgi:hypothetical protein